jgi:endonuclease YncB( thermonuclease family)
MIDTPRHARLLLAAVLLCLSAACRTGTRAPLPHTPDGLVTRIVDGDTIEVQYRGAPAQVRLYGIDCPERRQAYGTRARQAASGLAFGKRVTLETHGRDRNGRILAYVILPDGRSLNHELVRAGFAWWFERYAPQSHDLRQLEAEARAARRGLWADPDPAPPWSYRKRRAPAS